MKHRNKQSKQRFRSVQRTQSHYRQFVPTPKVLPPTTPRIIRKVFIYEGEYRRLCLETLRMGKSFLETGGQFFGKVTWQGTPVIYYVLGPGPNAEQRLAFFRQDLAYFEEEAQRIELLASLMHIGEWHSHHQLGLSVPSGHDSSTMRVVLNSHPEMSMYLLCIATCDNSMASATPFMYNLDGFDIWDWEIIPGESPVRKMLES